MKDTALSKHKIFPVSQSCGNFNVHEKKRQSPQQTCSSQPFLKPHLTLHKVIETCRQLILHSSSKKQHSTHTTDVSPLGLFQPVCQTLNVQLPKPSVLPAVTNQEEGRKGKEGKGLPAKCEIVQPSQAAGTPEWHSMARSAVKITLDPKTANPTLRLSNDRRRVRSYMYEESKAMEHAWCQRDRHKYDGWLCIQGAQGFSSGRQYWEVDVRGICDWRIGVLRESAPKRGFSKLNTSTGYWTLRLQLGSLIALTEPVTKLNTDIPSRVGVYLDIEGREVAFFDPKRRRHIYTFQADFSNSEKLYPVFGTVDTKKELVII
ncbi:hypothetical protein ACEWY4_022635 [Coilia grayii]|uniref:B30.2/SPRY domain-containing protein n=1 Tax=Coilia grayii TaxID=363190 RepID=A0ABD1J0V3_9TELE